MIINRNFLKGEGMQNNKPSMGAGGGVGNQYFLELQIH